MPLLALPRVGRGFPFCKGPENCPGNFRAVGGLTRPDHLCQHGGMDITTPRQRDIDRRLREATGLGLGDWLDQQKEEGASYGTMSRELLLATGDSVSDETLRNWYSDKAAA